MRMGAWSMARVLRQRIEYYYYIFTDILCIILNDTMYVVYGPVKEMPTCSMFVNLHYIIQYIILAMTVISILII